MHHVKQPIIHKAAVTGLSVNVNRTRLCLNDPALAVLLADGQIGIYALRNRRLFWLYKRQYRIFLGFLEAFASQIILPALMRGDPLRVRIVGLTPEHLARDSGAEVHVSIWGDLKHITPALAPPALQNPTRPIRPDREAPAQN